MGLSGHIQSPLPVYHTHPGAPPVPLSSVLASPAPLVSTALLLSLPSWEKGLYRGSVFLCISPFLHLLENRTVHTGNAFIFISVGTEGALLTACLV